MSFIETNMLYRIMDKAMNVHVEAVLSAPLKAGGFLRFLIFYISIATCIM